MLARPLACEYKVAAQPTGDLPPGGAGGSPKIRCQFHKALILLGNPIGEWCNGSTTDSDSVCLGSNPGSPAKSKPLKFLVFLASSNGARQLFHVVPVAQNSLNFSTIPPALPANRRDTERNMTVLIVLAAIVVGVALWMAPSGVALCTEGETSIARNSLRGRRSRSHRPPHKATMPQATCCRGSRPAPAGSSG
jgi:hypothetical protein